MNNPLLNPSTFPLGSEFLTTMGSRFSSLAHDIDLTRSKQAIAYSHFKKSKINLIDDSQAWKPSYHSHLARSYSHENRRAPRQNAWSGIGVATQKWEGYVLSVEKNEFTARLVDVLGSTSEIEVDLPLDEVSQGDLELVYPGAVFYWTIGYLIAAGSRSRLSTIAFRRLPKWTSKDKLEAENLAQQLSAAFK